MVARDYREVPAIDRLERLPVADVEPGPAARQFGLPALSRVQTAALAGQVKTGELADLLLLVLRMQEIYNAPRHARSTAEQELAEWLVRQPDVMRLALAQKLCAIARAHDMGSIAKVREPLTLSAPRGESVGR